MNELRRRSMRVACPRSGVNPNVGRSFSENNLNRTPEVFQSSFRGRPQQHAAAEFGLPEDEQFQHPRMFRNLNFSTDRAQFDAMRNQGPCRPAYQHRAPRFSDLPSERIEDFTNPSFNVTASSQISNLTNECLNDVSAPAMMSSVNQSSIRSPMPDECLSNVSAPPLCDVSIPSPLPARPPPCRPCPELPAESLNDVSAPSLYQSAMASASSSRTRSLGLTNECLNDVSAPSFGGANMSMSSRSRSGFPDECLNDVSAPSMYRSGASSRNQSSFRSVANECLDNVSAPSLVDISAPSFRSPRQRTLPNECLSNVSAPSMYQSVASSMRSPQPEECLNEVSAPSLCDVSMPSPLPARPPPCPRQLTDECLDNISAPSMNDLDGTQTSSRYPQNNECLDEVSAPSFHTTAESCPSNGSFVDKTYNEILKRFKSLKASIFGGECPVECADGGDGPSNAQENASILCDSEMETDDVFGNSQVLQPACLRGAEQVTTTQFQGAGNDLVRETVVERSAINNGMVEKTIQRTITSRDKCGNVTTQMNETRSSTPDTGGKNITNISDIQAPSFMDSGIGSGLQRPDPISNISQLRSEARRRLNFSLPQDNLDDMSAPDMDDLPSMTADDLDDMSMPTFDNVSSSPLRYTQHHMPDECLQDVSAPSFGRSLSMQQTPPRRDRSLPRCSPAQQLMDISAPSFRSTMASSMQSPMQSEFLDQVSMPSFNDYASPPRRAPFVSMAPEFLENACPPAMGRSPPRQASQRQRTQPSEFLDQVSMPSYRSLPPATPPRRPQQVSWPSECLDDMSEPGMDDVPSMTAEDLDDMSMPTFDNVSSSPLRFTQHHMPDECLQDVSAPSFGRSLSMQQTPPRRDRSLPRCSPAQQLMDISAPSFRSTMASSMQSPMQSEFLDQVSMPSFNDYASPPRRVPFVSMAPEFLENACPPVMGRSPPRQASQRQRTQPSEFLDQVSMPSYRSLPPATPPRRPQQVSWPSECLDDMSAPGMDDVPSMTAEDLDDMSMPTFDNVSSSPLRFTQHHMPDECLQDVSAPSFGRSLSMQQTPPRRDRSLPRCSPAQQLMDISAPSFRSTMASSMQSPMQSEFLDQVSMPSFNDYASPPRRAPFVSMAPEFLENACPPAMGRSPPRQASQRQRTQPSEFLDQVSMPSFGSLGRSYSSIRPQSLPSQQLCDQSAPSFQSTGVSSYPSTRIDDMSMPSFDNASYSPLRQRRRSCSLPRELIFDETAPSFATSGASSRNISFPSERLESMQMPSYGRTISMTNERLDDMSAPSFGRSMSPSPRRPHTLPSQQILDTSQPSYYSADGSYPSAVSYPSERLDEMSMPPFSDSGPTSPPRRQRTLPSEFLADQSAPLSFADSSRGPATPSRLDDVSAPSFNSTGGSSYLHLVNNRVEDISAPSMMNDSMLNASTPLQRSQQQLVQEQIANTSAPLPDKTVQLTTSVTSVVRLDDITPPPYKSSGAGGFSGRQRQLTLPDENLGDVSAPSMLQTTPVSSRGHRSPLGRRIEDITAPSFATTVGSDQSSYGSPGRSRQMYRNQTAGGGFDSMANYAPFDEQIQSPNRSSSRSPCARPNPCARSTPYPRPSPCDNNFDDSYESFSNTGPQFNSTFAGRSSRRNDKPCCRNRNRTR